MDEEQAQPEDAASAGVGTGGVGSGDGDRESPGPVNVVPHTPNRLSARIHRLAEGFALGKTQREAATYAGVSPRTARRWQQDPEFRAAVTKLRHEAFDQTVGELTAAAPEAIAVIRHVMRTSQNDTTRLRAAQTALSFGHAAHSHEITQERLIKLEARIDAEQSWVEEDDK